MISCALDVAIAATAKSPQLNQVLSRIPFGNGLELPKGMNKNAISRPPAGTTGKI